MTRHSLLIDDHLVLNVLTRLEAQAHLGRPISTTAITHLGSLLSALAYAHRRQGGMNLGQIQDTLDAWAGLVNEMHAEYGLQLIFSGPMHVSDACFVPEPLFDALLELTKLGHLNRKSQGDAIRVEFVSHLTNGQVTRMGVHMRCSALPVPYHREVLLELAVY